MDRIGLVALLESITSIRKEPRISIAFPALLENMGRLRPIKALPMHALLVNSVSSVQVDLAELHVPQESLVTEHHS